MPTNEMHQSESRVLYQIFGIFQRAENGKTRQEIDIYESMKIEL